MIPNVASLLYSPRSAAPSCPGPSKQPHATVFYVFAKEMPNTVRYDITYSMNPFRNRLLPQKSGSQAKRDISRWNTSRKPEETGFWAFPVHVPGSALLYVDWTR